MSKDYDQYEKNGVLYTRVSTILDYFIPPELADWRAREGNRKANLEEKEALIVGDLIDQLITFEEEFSSVKPEIPEAYKREVMSCYEGYLKFKKERGFKVVNMQKTEYSEEYLVAGTWDMELEGGILCDVKSNRSRIWKKNFLQVAAYNWMREKRLPEIAILRLDKDIGDYEFKRIGGLEAVKLEELFRYLVELYGFYKSN